MVKATILHRPKKSLKSTHKMSPKSQLKLRRSASVTEYSPTERLLDETFIAQAVWECLRNNDPQGVMEIIETHLEAVNKVKAAQTTDLSRATMYHAFKSRNPTIKTLAKLVNCCG